MKNNNSVSAYERYLSAYLSRNNFTEADDQSFIIARSEHAYDVFCDARRNGVDVDAAQELAMLTLMQDFDGESFEELARSILEDYCPEEACDFFLADMEESIADLRDRYVPGEYTPGTPGYETFKTELLGVIDDYFTTYFPEYGV